LNVTEPLGTEPPPFAGSVTEIVIEPGYVDGLEDETGVTVGVNLLTVTFTEPVTLFQSVLSVGL
jgi:hypothetical protein